MRLLSGRHMRRLPRSLQRTGLAKKLYAHLPALAGMTPAVTMLSAAAIPNRAFSAEALPPPSTVRVHAPLEKIAANRAHLNRSPPLRHGLFFFHFLFAGHCCGESCPPTENACQFGVSCTPPGS